MTRNRLSHSAMFVGKRFLVRMAILAQLFSCGDDTADSGAEAHNGILIRFSESSAVVTNVQDTFKIRLTVDDPSEASMVSDKLKTALEAITVIDGIESGERLGEGISFDWSYPTNRILIGPKSPMGRNSGVRIAVLPPSGQAVLGDITIIGFGGKQMVSGRRIIDIYDYSRPMLSSVGRFTNGSAEQVSVVFSEDLDLQSIVDGERPELEYDGQPLDNVCQIPFDLECRNLADNAIVTRDDLVYDKQVLLFFFNRVEKDPARVSVKMPTSIRGAEASLAFGPNDNAVIDGNYITYLLSYGDFFDESYGQGKGSSMTWYYQNKPK